MFEEFVDHRDIKLKRIVLIFKLKFSFIYLLKKYIFDKMYARKMNEIIIYNK